MIRGGREVTDAIGANYNGCFVQPKPAILASINGAKLLKEYCQACTIIKAKTQETAVSNTPCLSRYYGEICYRLRESPETAYENLSDSHILT